MDPDTDLEKMGENARRVYSNTYSKDLVISMFDNMLARVEKRA